MPVFSAKAIHNVIPGKPKTAIQSEVEALKKRWKNAKFVKGYNVEYQARNNESFRKEL